MKNKRLNLHKGRGRLFVLNHTFLPWASSGKVVDLLSEDRRLMIRPDFIVLNDIANRCQSKLQFTGGCEL
ncbi:hypothetical protein [Paenibacillus zanthoxyli]|uniref:hypothetical protein n=1 Tax=Paenibacillus zanthoxyli TaxID=369399 RepID=UPI000472AD10|nr:hypothetical protein [Paenibacillus zanthoxyli]